MLPLDKNTGFMFSAKKGSLFLVLAIFASICGIPAAYAGGTSERETVVEDKRERWVCLFTELDGRELEERYRYLLSSIPLLLMDSLEEIPRHALSEDEVEARKKRLIREKIDEKEVKIASLVEERDRLFLEDKKGEWKSRGEKIERLRSECRELRELLALLSNLSKSALSESEISVEGKLPFEIYSNEKGDTDLAPPPKIPLRVFADEREVDAVLVGRLEQIEDALYLTLRLYNRDTDTAQELYQGVVFPENVEGAAEEAAKELGTHFLGRKWAHLSFDILPDHAHLFVGDHRYAGGKRILKYLEPGEYSLRAEAAGYTQEAKRVTLREGETTEVALELEPVKTVGFSVETEPAGGEIFSGAVFLGISPLELKEMVLPITLLAKKEGFYDYSMVVKEEPKEDSVFMNLHPLSIQKERIVEAARSRFYRGVAGFFLSLPITIISYGMSTEYAYAFNSSLSNPASDYDERSRLHGLSTVWYTAYLGGLFLNGVFLIDSIVQMKYYIRAAEGR